MNETASDLVDVEKNSYGKYFRMHADRTYSYFNAATICRAGLTTGLADGAREAHAGIEAAWRAQLSGALAVAR